MIRSASWKYILRSGDGPEELYDLDNDPDERRNLAAEQSYRHQARELEAALRDWFGQHAEPQRDAWKRPVSGRGQLLPAGSATDGLTYHSGEGERRASGLEKPLSQQRVPR